MSAGPVREPAVAGMFYTAVPAALAAEVASYLEAPGEPLPCQGLVVPHAGYRYSGRVAGETFASALLSPRVVVLAVNHRGRGERLAAWAKGVWRTPLGDVPVDEELVAAIQAADPHLRHDPAAHLGEHSLEVQVPFLQAALGKDLRIAPLSIACHDLDELAALGHAVARAVAAATTPVLIVASTDLTHYEDAASARRKDRLAIDRILEVDGPGLLRVVLENDISMCGVGPTTAALVAARDLGSREGHLVRYATSGDVTGDDSSVVGYAGVVLQ